VVSGSGVSSFGEDEDGHLYYANVGTGNVYEIVPTKGEKKG
jgi:hypothetical protein